VDGNVSIPIGWLLTTILGLGTVIATLAGIIFKSMSDRLTAQDKIIEGLRGDIERMAKGCGFETCHWRHR